MNYSPKRDLSKFLNLEAKIWLFIWDDMETLHASKWEINLKNVTLFFQLVQATGMLEFFFARNTFGQLFRKVPQSLMKSLLKQNFFYPVVLIKVIS